jgi:cyclic pyranopterin phosphate synthase
MSKLSHLDEQGRAAMVDVSPKSSTERIATAEAVIVLSSEAFELVLSGGAPKGDVLATARIAGIMAAKKTPELIPLCHPLALSHASVDFTPDPERHAFQIVASVKTVGPTGVEMEALTAASVAALTVYDMIKAVDKSAVIESVRLLSKSGGKSGTYEADMKAAPVGEAPAPASSRPKAAPRVLIHEMSGSSSSSSSSSSAPRARNTTEERVALRAFMSERRLRATEWAKAASVPLNDLYGFLSGRSRAIPPASAERLASAARVSVDTMLGRKGAR